MNKLLKNLVLEIDPLVRQYHRNVISFYTDSNALKADSLDLEASKYFLMSLWARCLEWSNQRPSRIENSLHQFNCLLDDFKNSSELHDIKAFVHKLMVFREKQNLKIESNYNPQDDKEKIIELFTMFYSVRIKTASLITRFLCLDSNFFGECSSATNPPLDRVNYRMLERLEIHNGLEKKNSYGPKDQKIFANIGTEILGKELRGSIDNLWFIGHFYCDDNEGCAFREVFRYLEAKIVNDIDFPQLCPLIPLNCGEHKKKSKR